MERLFLCQDWVRLGCGVYHDDRIGCGHHHRGGRMQPSGLGAVVNRGFLFFVSLVGNRFRIWGS